MRNERDLCGPSFTNELSTQMYDFPDTLRKIPTVKVSADTGLLAYFELGFLTSEGHVDQFLILLGEFVT